MDETVIRSIPEMPLPDAVNRRLVNLNTTLGGVKFRSTMLRNAWVEDIRAETEKAPRVAINRGDKVAFVQQFADGAVSLGGVPEQSGDDTDIGNYLTAIEPHYQGSDGKRVNVDNYQAIRVAMSDQSIPRLTIGKQETLVDVLNRQEDQSTPVILVDEAGKVEDLILPTKIDGVRLAITGPVLSTNEPVGFVQICPKFVVDVTSS